ncbi:uncharacterized protein ACRADG_005394 isoform 2-T2 [Cochliomyia hominivorax]
MGEYVMTVKHEIQTEKRQKRVKPSKPTVKRKDKRPKHPPSSKNLSSLTVDSGENFYELNTDVLEPNYLVAKDSIDPRSIKPVGIQDGDINAGIERVENEAEFEIVRNYEDEHFNNNIETLTINKSHESLLSSSKPNDLVEFSANSKKTVVNFNDSLNQLDQPKRNDIKLHYKRNRNSYIDDPLDESVSTCKNDRFDQWAYKKQKLMDLEYIEMRNYKLKLELWEKEQQLHLTSSKFTRDIRSYLS